MLIDRLFAPVAPHECLGCGAEGTMLCSICSGGLVKLPPRCYRCHTGAVQHKTCPSCRRTSALFSVQAYTSYEGLAKELLWQLKYSGVVAAAHEMAGLLAEDIPQGEVTLVPVPTATSRVRQRGYDQAQLLARELCRQTGAPYLPALRRLGQHHQVGAGRERRLRQLQHAYRAVYSGLLRGKHVVLIDDVLTTGATLESAATAVKSAGAKRVSAVVFAQA